MADMQNGWIASQSEADAMIANAKATAALPYEERLKAIGRSVNDTLGRLNDLEKITDYYQASIVAPWEAAAAAGRGVNGDNVKNAMAGRIAEIGKAFDLADENTQAYLDRIGGVPISQQVAITDSIRELQNPYEGLATADMEGWRRSPTLRGTTTRKRRSLANLAHEQFLSEADEFSMEGQMNRNLDALREEPPRTLGRNVTGLSLWLVRKQPTIIG